MRTRTLIAIFIAFMLTVGGSAVWSASTTEREGDPDANILEDSGTESGNSKDEKKKGNKVARVLTAPFKAFGRLFSRKDDNKLQRSSEKDAERFESVGVTRVEDSRTPAASKLDASASAKEHLASGRSHLLSGRINEAISELSLAVSIDRKLTEAHNLLGVAYDKKGLADRAKESYERAVKEEPEDAQTLNNLGFSLYQNGNYRAAVDRLKRAAKLAPNDERILNNLGLALCRLGKFQDAFKHFARATGPLTGNLNTARMLERFGREDDAIRYYEDARRIDPSSTIALRRLADLYERTGRPEQAKIAADTLARNSVANAANAGR
ncbi:MAG TPA: tetratricopeptide repeat protein [Pyrinomonadaceae bacterium]|nr:tetratricopeptide repeat protein [Pyrinomonadaceae bacterium]